MRGVAGAWMTDMGTGGLSGPCANTREMQARPNGPGRYPNRWRPGQSGNPNGRPQGSRHRATILAETLLDGQAAELIEKTIERALAGDGVAMRLCIERIVPPRRDRPVNFRLPALVNPEDVVTAIGAITDGVATGELTPTEAAELAKVVEAYRNAVEMAEIERRLSVLEASRGRAS